MRSVFVRLPGRHTEPLQHFVFFTQFDLNFLPHVEYRAVLACADDLFVQGALTPLALGPKSGELVFQCGERPDLFLVDGTFFRLAMLAHSVVLVVQGHLENKQSKLGMNN